MRETRPHPSPCAMGGISGSHSYAKIAINSSAARLSSTATLLRWNAVIMIFPHFWRNSLYSYVTDLAHHPQGMELQGLSNCVEIIAPSLPLFTIVDVIFPSLPLPITVDENSTVSVPRGTHRRTHNPLQDFLIWYTIAELLLFSAPFAFLNNTMADFYITAYAMLHFSHFFTVTKLSWSSLLTILNRAVNALRSPSLVLENKPLIVAVFPLRLLNINFCAVR